MNNSILDTASNYAKESFSILNKLGYELVESNLKDVEKCEMVFTNMRCSKEIYLSVYNYDDVQRFFITVSISRIPYLSVNDFVSFDVYLKKSNLSKPETLTGDFRNYDNIKRYVDRYAALFEEHGINLINSKDQFPNNFPEWT